MKYKRRKVRVFVDDGAGARSFTRSGYVTPSGSVIVKYGSRWYFAGNQGGEYRLGSEAYDPTSRSNPGGKTVRLKNFTGTICRLPNGTVEIKATRKKRAKR